MVLATIAIVIKAIQIKIMLEKLLIDIHIIIIDG